LLKNRLRSLFGGTMVDETPVSNLQPPPAPGPKVVTPVEMVRQSNGLDQFFMGIRGHFSLQILDMTGASQANIGYITSLGHRIYSEDFLRALDSSFGGAGDFFENQTQAARIENFQGQTLDYDERSIDGALVWDSLQYLTPQLLEMTVEQLHRILRPGGQLLAVFHADEKATEVPAFSYRIQDHKTVALNERTRRRPAQFFNNRALEKLFRNFDSVKFFLTRDSLREVIVRR
jgi:hypothetical protein